MTFHVITLLKTDCPCRGHLLFLRLDGRETRKGRRVFAREALLANSLVYVASYYCFWYNLPVVLLFTSKSHLTY